MTNEEFYTELNNEITAYADARGILQEEAFFELATETMIEIGELSQANYSQFRKTGLQMDGYGGNLTDEDGVIKLILLDYSFAQDKPESLTNTDIQALVKRGIKFLEKVLTKKFLNELEESSNAFKLATFIVNQWKDVLKIKFILITNKQMGARVKQGGIKLQDVANTPIMLSVWDFKRFADINAQGNEREPLVIDMADYAGDIGILPVSDKSCRFPSYLAVVPGSALADIYDRYGTRLLEQNVRVYLQARGKINKGIQNTILDEPDMFFSYNNGLTATAESLEIASNSNGNIIKSMRNFQVVNGGQTMASIYHMSPYAKKKWKKGTTPDINDVYVQMKLSIIPSENTKETVPKISRFSNSQNKVSDADFFSNHQYHVEMEKYSRTIVAPTAEGRWATTKWYYERMRGQYNNARSLLSDAKKREFENQYPPNQKFTKTELAKYLTPWEGKPEIAQKGAAKCFAWFATYIDNLWDKNPAFCNDVYYKECIAKAIIFKSLEKIVSAQPWYKGGGTRAPIVLHTIGKLAHDLSEKNLVFPYINVWNKQMLNNTVIAVLVDLTALVADVILNPFTLGQLETEWAKQQLCSETIAKVEYLYPDTFLASMNTKDEHRDNVRDAIKNRKLTNSVEAQIFVALQDDKFWNALLEWGETREILNTKDISIISTAKHGNIPSEKQCEHIMHAYGKSRDAGFNKKPKLPE